MKHRLTALALAALALLGVGVAPAQASHTQNANAYSYGCRSFWRATVLWERLDAYTWKDVTATITRVDGAPYVPMEHLRVYGRYFHKSGSPNYALAMYDRYFPFGAVHVSNIPGNGFVVDTRNWIGDVVFKFEEQYGNGSCYVVVNTPTV